MVLTDSPSYSINKVALTGERDMLINHLDSVKQELRRELAAARGRGGGASSSRENMAGALAGRRK